MDAHWTVIAVFLLSASHVIRQEDALFAFVEVGQGLEGCMFVLDRKVMFSCHFAGRMCLCFIMLHACSLL